MAVTGDDAWSLVLTPGRWFHQPYRAVMEGAPHLAPQRPDGFLSYLYDLAALSEGEGAVAEFVGIVGHSAEERADTLKHWDECGHVDCRWCAALAEMAANFATRYGLLGAWAEDSIGDLLMEPRRQAGAFGPDYASARTEPLGVTLHASAVLGELWDAALQAKEEDADEEYRADAVDALLWGGRAARGAKAMAEVLAHAGHPPDYTQTFREVTLRDPTAWGGMLGALLTAFRPDQAATVQVDLREWADKIVAQLGSLRPPEGAEEGQAVWAAGNPFAGLMKGITPAQRSAAAATPGVERPLTLEAVAPSGLSFDDFPAVYGLLGHDHLALSHGLNRVLSHVGMELCATGQGWQLRARPLTLWAALHIELATKMVFGGQVPARCEGCGAAYWRRTAGRRNLRQRCAPGHDACRKRLSRRDRPPRGEA